MWSALTAQIADIYHDLHQFVECPNHPKSHILSLFRIRKCIALAAQIADAFPDLHQFVECPNHPKSQMLSLNYISFGSVLTTPNRISLP